MSKDLMIDLETLGTTGDAVILSIGAVKFDIEKGTIESDGFYRSISVESNLALRRRISEDTLIWWFKQEAAAQAVFHEPKETLGYALVELSDWVGTDDYTVWSNGASFDIPMLEHAYTQCGTEIPWKFWNSRCHRTLRALPGAKAVPIKQSGVKHNALADAYTQAQHAIDIHKALFGAKPAVKAAAKKAKA
jgi:hypothetical protein